ncbi:MAG: signal peptide peptidase SppA [Phycisphaerae bacterium]|nr:signal peptide peptidase SppA [Phycisphaerae bacterium]
MKKRYIAIQLTVVAVLLFTTGCGTGAFQIQMIPRNQELTETQIKKDEGWFVKDKIVVIDVDGVLINKPQDSWMRQGDNPVSTLLEKLDKAAGDDDVKAVVLRINSPGGSVAASDMMHHSLAEFKQKKKVPVVACMMDVAASGGYYLACGADGMMAQPSTVTGSIGTIMQTFSVAGTMEKIGIEAVAVKSGKMKDIASPLHDMTDEEKQILQEIIDRFYEQFLTVVDNGRPKLEMNKLQPLADGRVFIADQAKELGLIDRIGYADDAVQWAKEMAGVEKVKTVIYHRPMAAIPNIYGSATSQASGIGPLVNIVLPDWLESGGTQFLYLWQPGL